MKSAIYRNTLISYHKNTNNYKKLKCWAQGFNINYHNKNTRARVPNSIAHSIIFSPLLRAVAKRSVCPYSILLLPLRYPCSCYSPICPMLYTLSIAIQRPSNNTYHVRHTTRTTAVVHAVRRPPEHHPYTTKKEILQNNYSLKSKETDRQFKTNIQYTFNQSFKKNLPSTKRNRTTVTKKPKKANIKSFFRHLFSILKLRSS